MPIFADDFVATIGIHVRLYIEKGRIILQNVDDGIKIRADCYIPKQIDPDDSSWVELIERSAEPSLD